ALYEQVCKWVLVPPDGFTVTNGIDTQARQERFCALEPSRLLVNFWDQCWLAYFSLDRYLGGKVPNSEMSRCEASMLPLPLQRLKPPVRHPLEVRFGQFVRLRSVTRGLDWHPGFRLSGLWLSGINLARVELVEADLRGADLRGADLGGANLMA